MAFKRTTKVLSDTAMSSMTDLVFLLLIFFLITSTLVNPNALKLLLPKSTGQVSAKPTVTVSIKDWGDDTYTYHLNGSETPCSTPNWRMTLSICFRQRRIRHSRSTLTRACRSRKSCR